MSNFLPVQPRIGVMAVGLGAYWPQFEGMREQLLVHHQEVLDKLRKHTVVPAGMVDSASAARKVGELFRQNDVDLVFCHITTYSTSDTLLPAIRELNVPVILLNVQSVKSLDWPKVQSIQDWLGAGVTCAALPEMTAALNRLGTRYDIITGYLNGDEIVDSKLEMWCKTASLKRKMKDQNIGLLGRPYPGMMDLNVDETHLFKKFGAQTRRLGWKDVIQEMDRVTQQEKEECSLLLKSIFANADHLTGNDLDQILVTSAAFVRLVRSHRLFAIPNHFEGEPDDQEARLLQTLNPAMSILTTYGVPCPVEADMKSAIAMTLLKLLAGTATLAELYSMDFNEDVCIVGHSGAADAFISSEKAEIVLTDVFHGKAGGGFVTQFLPNTGPVTLISLTQNPDGDYAMIVAEGECVEGPGLRLGDTNCRVSFSCGVREFVNKWSRLGPTHHGAIGHGHHIEALKCVSVLFDIPMHVVCQ